MKVTTYKSLLTNRKTMVVLSSGKCGHANFREYTIVLVNGTWVAKVSDGYNINKVFTYPSSKALKSVINLVWGR